ncbi:hypothetical protein WJX79_003813 [Trebouxia sp. C0005]
MDFSFVGSGNPLKRKAAADAEQPVSKPVAPVASASSQAHQTQARPRVQLPSLQQVQAAQRSQSGLNTFQASTSASNSSHQPAATSSTSWANTSRPDHSTSSTSQQPHPTSHPPLRQISHPQPQQHQASSYAHGGRPPLGGSSSGSLSYQQPVSHQQATMVNPNAIFVSKRQEGNPVLKHIRNMRWQFADIIPDYQLGQNACAVFLSLRFHLLKPEYVHHRIKELQRSFRLRLLICHIDVEDVVEPLAQVIKAALLNEVTLICGWSPRSVPDTWRHTRAMRPSQQMLFKAEPMRTTFRGSTQHSPLCEDSVLETPMDDINDDPDGDFEVDL